jgi:GNAT superfamily N-acetyltransferase
MTTHPDITIRLETEIASADATRTTAFNGLRAYNRLHAVAPGFLPLILGARTPDDTIIGGLVGETGWEWLHVDLLWVAESHRRHGVGRELLRRAEAEAARRGCRHAYLDTFDFQARPFYEREGYTVFGVQDDFPPGHHRFYLEKSLTAPQTT